MLICVNIRGPFRTQILKKLQKYFVRKLFTLLGKNQTITLFPTSYIQKKTPNQNIIFKISIYYTKYTKNTKIHSKNIFYSKSFENRKI